jgi:NAD(P)-dependent dehydrogenase (short-subunit alcohol dehydrogenase family)
MTTDLVLPGMRRRGWGRVITSASSGAVMPSGEPQEYADMATFLASDRASYVARVDGGLIGGI